MHVVVRRPALGALNHRKTWSGDAVGYSGWFAGVVTRVQGEYNAAPAAGQEGTRHTM
jgi:hypothetical protein